MLRLFLVKMDVCFSKIREIHIDEEYPLPTPPVRVSPMGLLGRGRVEVAYTSVAFIIWGLLMSREVPLPWCPEGTGVMALDRGALWGSGGLWGAEVRPCMGPLCEDGGPGLRVRTVDMDVSGPCRLGLLEVLMCRGACWDRTGPPELLGLVLAAVLLPLLLLWGV